MKIIKIAASENGSRPPLQDLPRAVLPSGYAAFPEKFLSVFYQADKQCAGFVDITVEGDTVTACTWNEEAYQAYLASLPEPEEPAPTPEERIAALEEENHLLSQQVTALTDQNDFQEELIVELAGVVYA